MARTAHEDHALVTELPTRLLNEVDTALYLSVSVRTLQNWRLRGGGPRYVKIGNRAVRYRVGDLDAWVSDQLRNNTSETAA